MGIKRDGISDIRAVAKHARVSVATVSRVINRVSSVNATLSTRVWKAVGELNFSPDMQARALVSGKSKLLGLVVSEFRNPLFSEFILEFERAAVVHGYEILVSSTDYDAKTMELSTRRMLERNVDGIAIMTFGIQEFATERLVAAKVPVVFIDIATTQPNSDAILVDSRAGIYQGVRHLAAIGHRRIGFIAGPLRLHSAEMRKAAFLDSAREIGININQAWIVDGHHTLDSGRQAMESILTLSEWPTAIMCSNDLTAIGVQHAVFEAGLKVPDDFSLIGFDDARFAEYTTPPLTTIRISHQELARAAVSTLVCRDLSAEGESGSRTKIYIGTSLVVRRTTGVPKLSRRITVECPDVQ